MKNYLRIQSAGEIEQGAFTLIGASTKRNDQTKIGYYGSGLKYSISSLIRNGIDFKIFSGDREVLISTENQSFRTDSFEVILVDGQKTSLTTNMGGSDWDNPFAPIREIYSNALDEDEDASLVKIQTTGGLQGFTTFYIEMTENVKHFYENVNAYFCNQNENVLASNDYGAIYPALENQIRLFRKNILCYHNSKMPSLFNYNSGNYTINESRVLSSGWVGQYYTGMIWKGCVNENLIETLINGMKGGNSGLYEHTIDWASSGVRFSKEWNSVCSKMKFAPAEIVMYAEPNELEGRTILPKELLVELYRQFDDLDILGLSSKSNDVKFIIKETVSQILTNKVIDAISLLNKTNYKFRFDDLDIKYVSFIDESALGMAENGVIYLSTKLDSHDVNSIAKIIIEENEHNKTGYGDKTRAFQDHLFNLLFEELTMPKL
jgi:hypothetical protein